MTENYSLLEKIDMIRSLAPDVFEKTFAPDDFEIPKYVIDNLKHEFFEWQKDAIENLMYYENSRFKSKKNPTHLMFNMATGTGKTLLMAACILYYYKQGYRHFLFFVNQKNIVDKTENNFINSSHTKYLFTEKIIIDDQTVDVQNVEDFSDTPQGIEIKFTTVQKLYNDIHTEKENQTTLDSLLEKNIVMLADEGHHLNANTAKGGHGSLNLKGEITGKTSQNDIERLGWEHTVNNLILHKNRQSENNKNVLLEFTATIPDSQAVEEKYKDKTIYKFDLKNFLRAGYTKQINILSTSQEKNKRILLALLFNWYRHRMALKHNIANFKPVILFRSKTIEESEHDHKEFLNLVEHLKGSDLNFLDHISNTIEHNDPNLKLFEMGGSRIEQILKFMNENDITKARIADFIKTEFQSKNVIITNSKDTKAKGSGGEKTTEDQDRLLNSLEDKDNHIRAIFTVQRLTEGWDVLNLFDIIRLYEGRDEGSGKSGSRKTGKSTTQEKQLIGRGVRYFPFAYGDERLNKRKFDSDIENELRILEELFFHSPDDHRYISELKGELMREGYIEDKRITKVFDLKSNFRESDLFKTGKVWYNEQIDNPNRRKSTLKDIKEGMNDFEYKTDTLRITEQVTDDEGARKKIDTIESKIHTIRFKFHDIENNIFRKAVHIKAKAENSLFQFARLKDELEIESIDDLQKEEFLGDFELKIATDRPLTNKDELDAAVKLYATVKFLDEIFSKLNSILAPKIGSDFKEGNFKEIIPYPKKKSIESKTSEAEPVDSWLGEGWYVLDSFYGTSEERHLVEFIVNSMGNLKERYNAEKIYLLRNEEVYKIYDFEQGRGFQPDFLLFLECEKNSLHYQIFIEPKGDQFKDASGKFGDAKEGWKEKFLEQITNKYGLENILKIDSKDYALIGLPFFNNNSKDKFEDCFNEKLELS